MKIALCDDQKMYNDKLKLLLKTYFKNKQIDNVNITVFTSGKDLLDTYSYGMFDFIFLDIQMPDLDGKKTAEAIRIQDLEVNMVFVTNMHDQSLVGYDYNAKGFLYKTVQQEDVDKLMDRLLNEMGRRKDVDVYSIKQKFDNCIVYLKLADTVYFESKDKDITAYTKGGNFVFRGRLNEVEEDLNTKGFIRIHNSILVNTDHIFKDFGDGLIMIGMSEKLPISKAYKSRVRNELRLRG